MQCDEKKALRGCLYENCSNSYLDNFVSATCPYCSFSSHIHVYFTIHNIQKYWPARGFELLPGQKIGSLQFEQLAISVIITLRRNKTLCYFFNKLLTKEANFLLMNICLATLLILITTSIPISNLQRNIRSHNS